MMSSPTAGVSPCVMISSPSAPAATTPAPSDVSPARQAAVAARRGDRRDQGVDTERRRAGRAEQPGEAAGEAEAWGSEEPSPLL